MQFHHTTVAGRGASCYPGRQRVRAEPPDGENLMNKEALVDVSPEEVTLAELARRLDILGNQMNWLCENLTSLFAFVNQMGQQGGGIRGLMHMLKQGPPGLATTDIPVDTESKVGA